LYYIFAKLWTLVEKVHFLTYILDIFKNKNCPHFGKNIITIKWVVFMKHAVHAATIQEKCKMEE